MPKPVLGLIVGTLLGIVDGLTALFYPDTAPLIMGIVIGSSIKGLIAGLIIGWFSTKIRKIPAGIIFGFAVGLILAYLVAMQPDPNGKHWYVEIMIPGSMVGLILGYVTQKYGRPPKKLQARTEG